MSLLTLLVSLFGCRKTGDHLYSITAQINQPVMPIERGEKYEDPLYDFLEENGLGSTDGGGSMLDEHGEIKFVDVAISLNDLSAIPAVIEKLESFGAPKGSILIKHKGKPPHEIPFGKTEGIAVYLDGTSLPDEIYKSNDINDLIAGMNAALGPAGKMECSYEGENETALYFYGESADVMRNRLKSMVESHPLCGNARVVQIAPRVE